MMYFVRVVAFLAGICGVTHGEILEHLADKALGRVEKALCLDGEKIGDVCIPMWAIYVSGVAGGILFLLAVTCCCCCCFRPCRQTPRAPASQTVVMMPPAAANNYQVRGLENPLYKA